ncbi:hypothetical protein L0P57_13030, partial [Anaeromassilibacillus senegalensis]
AREALCARRRRERHCVPAEDAVRPVKHCAVTIGLSISTKQNKQEKTFSLQITNLPPWQNPGWEIFFRNSQLLFSLPHKSLQNKKDLGKSNNS